MLLFFILYEIYSKLSDEKQLFAENKNPNSNIKDDSHHGHDKRNIQDMKKDIMYDDMDFDYKLYENIQDVLNGKKNDTFTEYNNVSTETSKDDFDKYSTPEEDDLMENNGLDEKSADHFSTTLKNDEFNILKWLTNKDNGSDSDSEAELQKIIESEKEKQREESVKNIEKANKNKKTRLERFLKWAKKRLNIE